MEVEPDQCNHVCIVGVSRGQKMKQMTQFMRFAALAMLVGTLSFACSTERKLEACRFVEIEPAETNSIQEALSERALREGWELEALCGDLLIDFKGSWLRRVLGVDIASAYDPADPTKGASSLALNGLSIWIEESSGKRDPKIWATSSVTDDEIQARKGDAWNFDQ